MLSGALSLGGVSMSTLSAGPLEEGGLSVEAAGIGTLHLAPAVEVDGRSHRITAPLRPDRGNRWGGGELPTVALRVERARAGALPALRLSARITNGTGRPVRLGRLYFAHPDGSRLVPEAPLLCLQDGYFSWNTNEVCALSPDAEVTSWWNCAVYREGGSPALILGFESAFTNNAVFRLRTGESGETSLCIEAHFDGVILAPGQSRETDPLLLIAAPHMYEGLCAWADAAGERMGARRNPGRGVGWCSWYYYYTRVTEEDVVANVEAAEAGLRDVGLRYVQIDDGYQVSGGDWEANEKFPHGMRWLADRIHGAGFKAGLWLCPFTIWSNSTVFREHRDWLLKGADGEPLKLFDGWGVGCYGLDLTHPDALAWIENLFRRVCREWGYDYVKIDFVFSAQAGEGGAWNPHDPTMTKVEAYRRGLAAIRKAAGEERFVLGCGAPILPSVGLVDGMRTGPDVAASWSVILPCVKALATRSYMHGRLFACDPDCLVVREPLTIPQARAWASAIALSGQMTLESDNLAELPPERLEIVRRAMPLSPAPAMPVDLPDTALPTLWEARVEPARGRGWWVVGLFNWEAEPALMRLDTSRYGKGPIVAFDYWGERVLGTFEGEVHLRMPGTSCLVLALHEATGKPLFLGTNRHISCGALDTRSISEREGRIRGEISPGWDAPCKVYFHLPPGWTPASGAEVAGPELATLEVPAGEDVSWEARFRRVTPEEEEARPAAQAAPEPGWICVGEEHWARRIGARPVPASGLAEALAGKPRLLILGPDALDEAAVCLVRDYVAEGGHAILLAGEQTDLAPLGLRRCAVPRDPGEGLSVLAARLHLPTEGSGFLTTARALAWAEESEQPEVAGSRAVLFRTPGGGALLVVPESPSGVPDLRGTAEALLEPSTAEEAERLVAERSEAERLFSFGMSLTGRWRFRPDPEDKGLSEGWALPSHDDSAWAEIAVPGDWHHQGYPDEVRLGWYRTTFTVPEFLEEEPLLFFCRGIDDADKTFLNGEPIGETDGWVALRRYVLPRRLLKRGEPNLLAVRVVDYGGQAGIYTPPVIKVDAAASPEGKRLRAAQRALLVLPLD